MNLYIRMLLALTLIGSGPALGHSMAPALLELEADSGGRVIARLKQSLTQTLSEPDYPPQCRVSREFPPEREEDAVWRRWQLDCENEGLPEGLVGWAELTEINVVLRLIPASGKSRSVLLHRNRPSYHIAEQPGMGEQFTHAVSSGLSHLFAGLDHLLFIIGLVLYLGRTRALVIAATLFTVGHSLTLAAVTLGLVRVPMALAELAIAGSILYLAVSLLKSRRLPANPGRANVLLMPTGFGLLHGMGFASVLESSGLRSGDLLINLLGFNVGIELGQLACIGAMLLLSASVRQFQIASRWRAAFTPTLVWVVGSVAAYWWWERTVELLI
ncbi:MAG: HupE/UreJ family protein [Marinobacter sp.]